MADLEQIIACQNCTAGWTRIAGRLVDWHECCVCETRGFLVVDAAKTQALPRKPKPLI